MSAPHRLPCNQIETHRFVTPGGLDKWAVYLRDLYQPRRLAEFWSKAEAIRAAKRLSLRHRVPFERGQRRPLKRLRARTKFIAWQKRQQRVAQRAAKCGVRS
jgi:hypothetical protein